MRNQRQKSKFKLSYDVIIGAGGTQLNEDDIEDILFLGKCHYTN